MVVLQGRRSNGRYALFQTDGRNWMIHRMDPPEDPTRGHPPERFELVQAQPGDVPGDRGWALETRWQGLRCVLTSSGGVVDLVSAGGEAVDDNFPEVRPIGRALGITEVVLDGVVAAPDGGDPYLRRRLEARSDSTRRRLGRDQPVAFVAFDLLWLDGHALTDRPWRQRRERLDELALEGPAWTTPSAYEGDPDAVAGGGGHVRRGDAGGEAGRRARTTRRSTRRPGESSPFPPLLVKPPSYERPRQPPGDARRPPATPIHPCRT